MNCPTFSPCQDEARAHQRASDAAPTCGESLITLLERYGTRSVEVAAAIAQADDRPLAGGILSTGELRYLAAHERIVHLADLVFRRTGLAFTGRVDRAALEELGGELAAILGWDDLRLDAEIEDCVARLCRSGGRTPEEFAAVTTLTNLDATSASHKGVK